MSENMISSESFSEKASENQTPPARKRKGYSVESVMLWFCGIFLGGIVLYGTLTGPARIISVILLSGGVFWMLFSPKMPATRTQQTK